MRGVSRLRVRVNPYGFLTQNRPVSAVTEQSALYTRDSFNNKNQTGANGPSLCVEATITVDIRKSQDV